MNHSFCLFTSFKSKLPIQYDDSYSGVINLVKCQCAVYFTETWLFILTKGFLYIIEGLIMKLEEDLITQSITMN